MLSSDRWFSLEQYNPCQWVFVFWAWGMQLSFFCPCASICVSFPFLCPVTPDLRTDTPKQFPEFSAIFKADSKCRNWTPSGRFPSAKPLIQQVHSKHFAKVRNGKKYFCMIMMIDRKLTYVSSYFREVFMLCALAVFLLSVKQALNKEQRRQRQRGTKGWFGF